MNVRYAINCEAKHNSIGSYFFFLSKLSIEVFEFSKYLYTEISLKKSKSIYKIQMKYTFTRKEFQLISQMVLIYLTIEIWKYIYFMDLTYHFKNLLIESIQYENSIVQKQILLHRIRIKCSLVVDNRLE